MANLGTGNDNVNIDGATPSFIDFGGMDTYTILNSLSGDVTITDNQASTINLPVGLTISNALFLSDGVQFVVNGHTVTLLGNPELFTFVFGGTPLDPTAGTPQTFAETATAFGTTIPAAGAAPNNATITGDVNADGSVGDGSTPPVGPQETFSLTVDAVSVTEGATATFTLTTTNVPAGTEVGYTITGVSAADVTGPLSSVATIGAGGSASISVEVAADQLTEGSETLTLSLDNGQASANTVVLDTSVANANSYLSGVGGNGVVSDFNIEIVFEGAFSTAERAAFEMAADYLSLLITSDLPDEGGIDDIRITALLEPIDGPFNVVGIAGPTALRPGSLLPSEGEMTFDTADSAQQVSDGTFINTVVHEMIHALGFGTIWGNFPGLATSGTDARFTGDNAIAAYNAEFAALAATDPLSDFGVPLESEGGHWDEALFNTEILTPILDSASDYMSALTVASLEDLGYDTIFDVSAPAAVVPQLDDFTTIGDSVATSLFYFLLDEDAELVGNPNRLSNIDVDGIRFTIGEGADAVEVQLRADAAILAGSHQGFVNALQAPLQALISDGTLPAGTTLTLDPTITDATFMDDGSESESIPAIALTPGDGSVAVATGFSRLGEAIGEYDVYGRFFSDDRLFYFLLDEDAELVGNPNRLSNIDVDGIRFTIGEGADAVEVQLRADAAILAGSHQGFVNALQAPLQALISDGTLPAGTTLTLDPTITDATFMDDGSESESIPAIALTPGDGSVAVATGFSRLGEAIGEYDVYGRFNSVTEVLALTAADTNQIDSPLQIESYLMMPHFAAEPSANDHVATATSLVGIGGLDVYDSSFSL